MLISDRRQQRRARASVQRENTQPTLSSLSHRCSISRAPLLAGRLPCLVSTGTPRLGAPWPLVCVHKPDASPARERASPLLPPPCGRPLRYLSSSSRCPPSGRSSLYRTEHGPHQMLLTAHKLPTTLRTLSGLPWLETCCISTKNNAAVHCLPTNVCRGGTTVLLTMARMWNWTCQAAITMQEVSSVVHLGALRF